MFAKLRCGVGGALSVLRHWAHGHEAKAKYLVLSHNSAFRYSGIVRRGISEIYRTLDLGL
jgi:hypothetical protein